MKKDDKKISRKTFLKSAGLAAATGLLASSAAGKESPAEREILQVWSCGGLAEAFQPANEKFEKMSGGKIAYTGAFAAALGKSLLGSAKTEVFAPRVLKLAKKLKKQGKMLWFKPLCFTSYELAVPIGNPAGISSITDMARPGTRVVLSPDASPPGGKAVGIILKKAGVLEAVKKNLVFNGDCVQRSSIMLTEGKADVSIVERRITRLPEFLGKLETFPIEEKFIPPLPVPFAIGMMKWAKNPKNAGDYIDFILSSEGQKYFENAGFIPAESEEGKRLVKKHGV